MKILNTVEQEAFESPPVFNSVQRKQYFDFPRPIQQAAASLRTPTNQLCFLLSCGYFKATKRFFPVRTFRLGLASTWLAAQASGWRRSNFIATPREPRPGIRRGS
jgi:hypothetical protein